MRAKFRFVVYDRLDGSLAWDDDVWVNFMISCRAKVCNVKKDITLGNRMISQSLIHALLRVVSSSIHSKYRF